MSQSSNTDIETEYSNGLPFLNDELLFSPNGSLIISSTESTSPIFTTENPSQINTETTNTNSETPMTEQNINDNNHKTTQQNKQKLCSPKKEKFTKLHETKIFLEKKLTDNASSDNQMTTKFDSFNNMFSGFMQRKIFNLVMNEVIYFPK